MRFSWIACVVLMGGVFFTAEQARAAEDNEEGFVSLFDGKSLDGWKIGANAESFTVQDGAIVMDSKTTAHLFYDGPVANHDFKNFHFKADVMTFPFANSGIYFHTKYQESGFPLFGMECQVNNSHKDWIRTGSLYGLVNVTDVKDVPQPKPPKKGKPAKAAAEVIHLDKMPVKDNEWYTQEIIVQGRHVVVKLAGQTVVDYTFPPEADKDEFHHLGQMTYLSRGTFALQGHPPMPGEISKVCFKNIRVKVLPD